MKTKKNKAGSVGIKLEADAVKWTAGFKAAHERLQLMTPAADCRFEVVPQPPAAITAPEGNDGDQEDADECNPPTLVGYAIVWNAVSTDSRKARILPGAVEFIDGAPVLAMYGHDDKLILGSTANGTLRMTQDAYGLRVEIDPPDTTYAHDVAELVEDGYVAGMSFGMYPVDFKNVTENGETITVYSKIIVDEVTITAIPAFPQTSINIEDDDEDETPVLNYHASKLDELRFVALDL